MAMTKKTFTAWAAEWLELMKPTVKGNTYAASYKNPVENHLIPHFSSKRLDNIRQADVQAYINLIAGKYALDTVKKHKSCLFQIFDMAIENEYCAKNPVRRLKIPKTKERAEKAVYTEEQARCVFNYGYMHRFGAEVQFMLETGVSRGELLAICWADVDLTGCTVRITRGAAIIPNAATGKQETVIGEPKNSYRKREIPISRELSRILRQVPRCSEYVFCNKFGEVNNLRTWQRRHFDVFIRDMREFYGQKGVEIPVVTPHQLRHTKASLLINSGKSPILVAKFLGHADLDMLLKRYAHSGVDELREQLEIN